MQLILIADNIINLDSITVLDIDTTQNPNFAVVHVLSDSNQTIIDITIPVQEVRRLMDLAPSQLRFAGTDTFR